MKKNQPVYYLGEYYKILDIGSTFMYLYNARTTIRADRSLVRTCSDLTINDHLTDKAKHLQQEIEFFKE